MKRWFQQQWGPASPHRHWMLSCLCLLSLFASAAHAQEGLPLAFTRTPVFKIPFSPDGNERRWRQVQLYVSTDQGRTWSLQNNVPPEAGSFLYTANQDGVYWFATRTIDLDNRSYPVSMDHAVPQLKVVVDTQPPSVSFRGVPPRDGQSQIEWDIRDENLDIPSLEVDYRLQGASEWTPLRVDAKPSGSHAWRPNTNSRLEARLRVRDRAGNEAEQRASVEPSSDGRYNDTRYTTSNPEPLRGSNSNPGPGNVPIRLVNSTHIELNYKVKDFGKSGISVVQLWWTQDARQWQKSPNEKTFNRETPQGPATFPVDVQGEGVYGFSLIAHSGVGLFDQPPQVGTPPQVWVEVDLTKPQVELRSVEVGRGTESGNLAITWRATDKNLGKEAITLSYSERRDGDWKTIVASSENTGRYVWRMPQDLPFEFFIKVEATDRAGNVGADQTQNTVKVDLAVPKTEILDVAPLKK